MPRLPLGSLAVAAAACLFGPPARAQDAATPRPADVPWVFDVRVVRVDAAKAEAVEVAPTWKSPEAPGGLTSTAWSDLLATLGTRGRTTLLLDQRVAAVDDQPARFSHRRKQPVVTLRTREEGREAGKDWLETTYLETGAAGTLRANYDDFEYAVEVSWATKVDETTHGVLIDSATWNGSGHRIAAGKTLVLSLRQQRRADEATAVGTEIYVFLTAAHSPAK